MCDCFQINLNVIVKDLRSCSKYCIWRLLVLSRAITLSSLPIILLLDSYRFPSPMEPVFYYSPSSDLVILGDSILLFFMAVVISSDGI